MPRKLSNRNNDLRGAVFVAADYYSRAMAELCSPDAGKPKRLMGIVIAALRPSLNSIPPTAFVGEFSIQIYNNIYFSNYERLQVKFNSPSPMKRRTKAA